MTDRAEADAEADADTDEAAQADGGEDDAQAGERSDEDAEENGDHDTVPEVKLTLYQLQVGVTGQTTDDLEDVEASATRLMDYLVEKAGDLEDHPDDRGLG
jgi:hypothetical protein